MTPDPTDDELAELKRRWLEAIKRDLRPVWLHAEDMLLHGNVYLAADSRYCRGCGKRMLRWRRRWAHRRCAATMARWAGRSDDAGLSLPPALTVNRSDIA